MKVILQTIATSIILGVMFGALLQLSPGFLPRSPDLIQYWSAANLFAGSQNPYDPAQLWKLQEPYGQPEGLIILWNPPILLPLIAPFAAVTLETAKSLWFGFSLAVFAGSVILLLNAWPSIVREKRSRWVFLLTLLTFVPLFETLAWGQISSLLLVGTVGFSLVWQVHGLHSYGAGIFLGLTLIKPHLLAPLYLVLFLASVHKRDYRLATGFVAMGLILLLAAVLFQPEVVGWYLSAMKEPPIYWRTPTLGSFLQLATGIHTSLIRVLPLLACMVTVIGIFLRGDGIRTFLCGQLMPVLLIPLSLLVSPYGWTYDMIVFLPVALSLIELDRRGPSKLIYLLPIAHVTSILLPAAFGQERGIVISMLYLTAAYVACSASNRPAAGS